MGVFGGVNYSKTQTVNGAMLPEPPTAISLPRGKVTDRREEQRDIQVCSKAQFRQPLACRHPQCSVVICICGLAQEVTGVQRRHILSWDFGQLLLCGQGL